MNNDDNYGFVIVRIIWGNSYKYLKQCLITFKQKIIFVIFNIIFFIIEYIYFYLKDNCSTILSWFLPILSRNRALSSKSFETFLRYSYQFSCESVSKHLFQNWSRQKPKQHIQRDCCSHFSLHPGWKAHQVTLKNEMGDNVENRKKSDFKAASYTH